MNGPTVSGMALYRCQALGPGAGGDFWSTSLHISSTRSISAVHSGWEAFLGSFVGTVMVPLWPDDQSNTQAITTLINEGDGKNVSQIASAVSHIGTGTGGTISQRSAVVVGMKDGTPTRAGRGRMYWPPVDATQLDQTGLLKSTAANAIVAGFKAAVDALDVADQLVIYHRPRKAGPNNNPPAKAGSISNVVEVHVGTIIGTQRKRTNRVRNVYTSAGV